jgi:hypothetical protein
VNRGSQVLRSILTVASSNTGSELEGLLRIRPCVHSLLDDAGRIHRQGRVTFLWTPALGPVEIVPFDTGRLLDLLAPSPEHSIGKSTKDPKLNGSVLSRQPQKLPIDLLIGEVMMAYIEAQLAS